jgi:hypothetical protein
MNLFDQLFTEEKTETRKPRGVKSLGPQTFRTQSNGQYRRQALREIAARRSKTNKRTIRNWLRNQQAIAVLRGQLQVIGVVPFHDSDRKVSMDTPMYRNTLRAVEKTYGGVSQAATRYADILRSQGQA